jgi:hypothetical protein
MLHRVIYWVIDTLVMVIKKVFSALNKPSAPTQLILHTYKNNPDFRASLVEEIVGQTIVPAKIKPSTDEFIAVLSIWLSREPLDEVLSRVTLHAGNDWFRLLDNHFFEKLTNTAATWRYKGLDDIADNLLKVGKNIATMIQKPLQAKEYEQELSRRQHEKGEKPLRPTD